MTSARALLADATARLAAAGVPSAPVDAELLLAHVLGVGRACLAVVADVDAPAADAYAALVRRRARREPLQHVVGTAPFRYLELAVGPGVFIPRPETELLIDAVLPDLSAAACPVVVDLCAGSGALALSVVLEAPHARAYAVEYSAEALAWLRRNAGASAVIVIDGDVTDPDLLRTLRTTVDVVVSNPPYVATTTVVEPEVRADPPDAVFAGTDGLALVTAVIARAGELLRPGGLFALEHDDSQASALARLLDADGRWTQIEDHADLSGRSRYSTARRVAAPLTAG
jgi:release factor glutamine methyltransferase